MIEKIKFLFEFTTVKEFLLQFVAFIFSVVIAYLTVKLSKYLDNKAERLKMRDQIIGQLIGLKLSFPETIKYLMEHRIHAERYESMFKLHNNVEYLNMAKSNYEAYLSGRSAYLKEQMRLKQVAVNSLRYFDDVTNIHRLVKAIIEHRGVEYVGENENFFSNESLNAFFNKQFELMNKLIGENHAAPIQNLLNAISKVDRSELLTINS